jgi:hypothetical protein
MCHGCGLKRTKIPTTPLKAANGNGQLSVALTASSRPSKDVRSTKKFRWRLAGVPHIADIQHIFSSTKLLNAVNDI